MFPIIASLAPVFLVIVLGAGLKALPLMDEAGWHGLERATYYIFFPAMIVMTMAKADLSRVPVFAMAAALIGGILAMTALLLVIRPLLARVTGMDGPAFTSVFQGATRWNSFVAIATAGALFGGPGLTLTAISVAAMIPLLNVLAVVMLQRFGQDKPVVLGPTLRALGTNPFIWSSVIGIVINAAGLGLPMIVMRFGDILGTAALGTGLWVSNLWYLNFSDRGAGRLTGMTRFATFWVEGGVIVGPAPVMRFDDSLFDLLGGHLEALTVERDFLPDTSTYGERQTASVRVPGALVSALTLTL